VTGKVEGIIVLVLIILLLFGSKKIPELARSIGESVKEVRNGFNGTSSSAPTPPSAPTQTTEAKKPADDENNSES
jgi:sec-independent protein translocase protein TatA